MRTRSFSNGLKKMKQEHRRKSRMLISLVSGAPVIRKSIANKLLLGKLPIADKVKQYRATGDSKITPRTIVNAVVLNGAIANARHKDQRRESRRAFDLGKLYGMTIEQYELRLIEQGSRCAVCPQLAVHEKHGVLHVDHDHKTGTIRGLLCHKCNTALGLADDSPDRLKALAAYLEKPSS